MRTPSLRLFSALLASGALVTMMAGTSCDAETEDLEIEDLEALADEDIDERSGNHDHDKDDHHHHDGKCDPHEAPKVKGKEIDIWPPNHKLHELDVEECLEVLDACDDWEAKIIKITSDEPKDAKGDGNTEPDIECDEDSFKVRAERQGKKDGRVYEVFVEVKHGHHDKKAVVVCEVEVDHDQSKKGDAVDSGDAYTVWCDDHHHH